MIDRFDYCEGTYLFCSEHHGGQDSELYARMSRLIGRFQFTPSPVLSWEHLSEIGREVYRKWCEREQEVCEYDSVSWLLVNEHNYDEEDECVAYFLEREKDEPLEESGLVNFDRSDFVNLYECYTHRLIEFYDEREDSLLGWLDQYCDACGYTSRMEALEGSTIEDPDDMKTAIVNVAMTYLGGMMLNDLQSGA